MQSPNYLVDSGYCKVHYLLKGYGLALSFSITFASTQKISALSVAHSTILLKQRYLPSGVTHAPNADSLVFISSWQSCLLLSCLAYKGG